MNAPLKTTAEAATDFVRRHIGPSPRDIARCWRASAPTASLS